MIMSCISLPSTSVDEADATNSNDNDDNDNDNDNDNNNILVAASDHRAALRGIETKMSELYETIRSANETTNSEDKIELLGHTEESLKRNIERIVQVIEDEVYSAKVHGLNEVQEIEVQYCSEDEFEFEDEEKQEDSDEEIDEDDLIDADAVKRAHQLRDEVRQASQNLIQYKDSITKKAELLRMDADYNAEEIQIPHLAFVDVADMKYAFRGKTKDATLKSDQVLEMVANLQKLTKQLNFQKNVLDEPIAQLEETMATVQKGIASTANPEQMSQTEKAIQSRTNEGGDTSTDEANAIIADVTRPPQERLAAFLAQHVA